MNAPAPPATHLDAASGLPLHPAARDALLAALDDGWADPDRLYRSGRRARLLLDGAREALAAALGARPDELVLAPGGCAASRWAVQGCRRSRAPHVVHTAVEHSCVLHAARQHVPGQQLPGQQLPGRPLPGGAQEAGAATSVPVDRLGRVDPDDVRSALRPDTAVVCVTTASHEVGTLQPVEEVAEVCRAARVPLHTDAAAAVGRTPLPAGWSLLSADARLWGGPPGVGVLVVRTGTRWAPPLPGDRREDAVDLPAVLAAAVGLQAVLAEQEAEERRLRPLVTRIRERVALTVPDVEVVGDPQARLPHLVTFSCLYADGEALLGALDRRGFAVSSGSSCTSDTLEPSHVLVAVGVLTHGNVRVSLSRDTTEQDVERFLAAVPQAVAEVRAAGGAVGL